MAFQEPTLPNPTQYSVGISTDKMQVTLNIPADDITPEAFSLLFSPQQARALSKLLNDAALVLESISAPRRVG